MTFRAAGFAWLAFSVSACGAARRGSGDWKVERFTLDEATIGGLQAEMTAGRATSEEIVATYLARIEALDRTDPALRSGIVPISHTQDTPGPMARTVTDAAIVMGAMTGVDARDEDMAASGAKGATDYTPFLKANALRGAR